MAEAAIDCMIIADNANLLYLTGRVFAGYAFIPADGNPLWLLRRPVDLEGEGVRYFRRFDELPGLISSAGYALPGRLGLEWDTPFAQVNRLASLFPGAENLNATPLLKAARAVKTPLEIKLMEESGRKHEAVYRKIPGLIEPGMTDHELQVEIERIARLEGCLGLFRIAGSSMELYMGNILVGENADAPSPYDFAMGGKGLHPSLPVGACGEELAAGKSIMVDLNGDFTGYMTDMTRVFAIEYLPELAMKAHDCSRRICRLFEKIALPGAAASDIYAEIAAMVEQEGLSRYFMGHRQHAGFVGHGLGIEINEWPVIAPRSRDILKENNAIALEPKFVIPHAGAVGIENTYIITPGGARSITNAPEEIIFV